MNQPPLNPDALEAAEDELWAKHIDHEGLSIGYYEASELVVSTYLAAALPEVTSVEERDALPVGTVVLTGFGLSAMKCTTGWLVSGYSKVFSVVDLPARVLYRPEVNDA